MINTYWTILFISIEQKNMYSVSFLQRRLRYDIIPYTIGSSLVFFFFLLFFFRSDVLSPKRISLGLSDTYCGTDIMGDIVEAREGGWGYEKTDRI